MTSPFAAARLQVIAGPSQVLRDGQLATLLSGWSGPVKRAIEPSDPERIVLDLDTPSLFEEPAAWVLRVDMRYLRKHAETFQRGIGPTSGAVLILVVSGEDKGGKAGDTLSALTKALRAALAWHEVGVPSARELPAWLSNRLTALPQGVEQPMRVATALIDHVGEDVDALVATIATLAVHAGSGPITCDAVTRLVDGLAERPIWEFTSAVLEGQARRAIELLYAGGGMEAQRAHSALAGEMRKLIACCVSADDQEVCAWSGQRKGANLHYARQRARALGRPALQRLLHGCYLMQRQLRQSGVSHELAVEMFVLHAQRIIRPRAP